MILFPHCKINLGLSVLEKLPDGYHQIETLMYPLPLRDILEILPSVSGVTQLTVTGAVVECDEKENLCYKAWELIHKEYGIPSVEMHLHKIIPNGAGLGGGSSDAAFTLKMLNEMFAIGLDAAGLEKLATALGMDCAFFIGEGAAIASHRGEVLDPFPLSLKGKFCLLIKPDIHVSTAEAYSGVHAGRKGPSIRESLSHPIEEWKGLLFNDFEESIFPAHGRIREIKEELYTMGAVYASMSGSGSSVFGIFDQQPDPGGRFKGEFCWRGEMG